MTRDTGSCSHVTRTHRFGENTVEGTCTVGFGILGRKACSVHTTHRPWTKYLNVGFSNKSTSKGAWRQVFICLRPPIPYPLPCYTLYEYCTCTPVYFHTGKGRKGVDELMRGARFAVIHRNKHKFLQRPPHIPASMHHMALAITWMLLIGSL